MRKEAVAMKSNKLWRMLAIIALLLTCGFFSYACATNYTLRRSIAAADRDPITGLVRGTEATYMFPLDDIAATSRTACLMIHGFGGSRQDFGQLGERLRSAGITVRMMRLPGHGTNPADFAFQPPGAHMAAVRQEFKNLQRDFDQVYVVGFSMGGALATLLAAEEPVDRLVLISPYYRINYRWYYLLPAETWNSLMGWAVPYAIKTEGYIRVNDRSVIGKFYCYDITSAAGTRQAVRIAKRARSPEILDKIKCPVLMLHAEDDKAASYKTSRRVYEMLSAPKEHFWPPRSSHVLLWDFDKEEVIARIENFLGIK
jgi:carboxylesterase